MFVIIRVICPTPLPSHGASSPCVLCDGYFYDSFQSTGVPQQPSKLSVNRVIGWI
ncbi:hypothetical protein VP277E431_P0258 [Vibrio phage 277E43-1]|nr:hypothetical protein VP277E431_P0258 [Vibrio phage 277E43-1]